MFISGRIIFLVRLVAGALQVDEQTRRPAAWR
jgi:hypothetical protein